MTPEQQARQRIEEHLVKCGWVVQDYADMNRTASPAYRFPSPTN
jgi:hypothetical protein